MNISALEAGNLVIPLDYLVAGAEPDEFVNCPSMAFMLVHSNTGTRLVFDLGIRRNIQSLPPIVHGYVYIHGEGEGKTCFPVRVEQTSDKPLIKGGVTPD
ncbi:hypothetical protein BS17DRAFT_785254 [Gyrodon lividus]|nr:hypothetical protein BS17DRAFT_785254 [Gyrodon lividus]